MAGPTVTVACKLPSGLLLRVFDKRKANEPAPGGYREVEIAVELPEQHVVNGFSHAQNMAPGHPIVAGFALTSGIPKEFWDKWLEQNRGSEMVKNGLIFAHEQSASVESKAKNDRKKMSGLERLDPENLPTRAAMNGKVAAVATDKELMKARPESAIAR